MEEQTLDKKYLSGLKFSGRKEIKDKESGKVSYKPFERALQMNDVLSFAERGKEIVIATADGKKHRVAK